jgi:hypothetical protein
MFWDKEGFLLVDFMEKGSTINSEQYKENLNKLRQHIHRVCPNQNMKNFLLLHGKVRPHTVLHTRQPIAKME